MLRLVISSLIVVGCGGTTVTERPHSSPHPDLSPALEPLFWLLGAWEGDHGSEQWIAASGAMFGIGFGKDGSFDAMIIDDGDGPGKPDGVVRFLASPNGGNQVEFRQQSRDLNSVLFANPAHDFPRRIAYRVNGEAIAATIDDGEITVKKKIDFAFRKGKPEPALELEAADRAFAEDTAKRGVDGWVAAFADDGGMLKKGVRIQGHAAIAEHMGPLLGSGKLAWEPFASGKSGNLGFTVGKGTFTGAKPEDSWRSSYLTIWKHTPATGWKVVFDAGRVTND